MYKKIISFLIAFFIPVITFAASADLSINTGSVWFSPANLVDSTPVTIFAKVKNNGSVESIGTVKFSLKGTGEQVGTNQPVSVLAGSTDDVFISWKAPSGTYEIIATLIPWDATNDNASNNTASIKFSVEPDADKDGIANKSDADDDNDGYKDLEDVFPLNKNEYADTDGDGIGDNSDTDSDNDGCPNEEDDLPIDATECDDTDKDKVGDNKDTDDDGDLISDEVEKVQGTDSLKSDTDDDGSKDNEDIFPLDTKEAKDFDKDSIGDNADLDDDNDEISDIDDKFPFNSAPILKGIDNKIIKTSINKEVVFDASKSYDPENEEISFLWLIDGYTFTQPVIRYNFAKTGEFNGQLVIKDSNNQEKTFDFKIVVKDYSLYIWIITIFVILLAIYVFLKYFSSDFKRNITVLDIDNVKKDIQEKNINSEIKEKVLKKLDSKKKTKKKAVKKKKLSSSKI